MRRRRRCLLVTALIVPSLVAVGPPAGGWPSGVPRLELRAASDRVHLFKYRKHDRVWLDLGVYLAAHDAPFEIRVGRQTYDDPVRAWQVFRRSGRDGLQELPSELLDGWSGFSNFVRIEVRDRDGNVLRDRAVTVCPEGWNSQRVDDTGPFDQTYPYWCSGHPLTRATVWGIDRGWAVAPDSLQMAMRLADGRYRATVSIQEPYRTLFGVSEDDASVTVNLRVRTTNDCRYCGAAAPAFDRRSDERADLTPAPTTRRPPADTTPDLVALPSFWIWPVHERRRDFLTFGANVWNQGPAPLVVEGFRAEGEDPMAAYQYFYRGNEIVGKAQVGTFEFDRRLGHYHWHFEQFARYALLDETRSEVVRSHKQSFCLGPTDGIDLTVDGAIWRPESFGFTQCGGETSLWIREVLPTGWGDTYLQWVGGQSFDITDVPNGTYWIEVDANPTGALFDGDPSNDVAVREVILGGSPGARTAVVPPWHGIDTEGFFLAG